MNIMNESRNSILKRFFLEQDKEEETEDADDGEMTIDAIDDFADDEEDEYYDNDDNDDDENHETEPIAPTGGNGSIGINVRMTSFGTDDGPVQNQYSPKEIERLNTLLASENSAIGEYFQASKETNVDILRRLYSDIGEEERFHSEQLLFAKSQLTGEPYVPRDPDVKHEYEELLALGMDEETAMSTAVDKVGLMNRTGNEVSIEETEQQMEAAIDNIAMIRNTIAQEYTIICIQESVNFKMEDRDNAIRTYTEAYINGVFSDPEYFFEATVNATEMDPKKQKIVDISIGGCFKFIGTIINAIRHLAREIAIWATNQRQHFKEKKEWLRVHKLSDIFKSGIHLYFWTENTQKSGFELDDAVKYLRRLGNCAAAIGDACGVNTNKLAAVNSRAGNDLNLNISDNFTANKNNIDQAIDAIRHVSLSKTKLMLNENTKENLLKNGVFGTDKTATYNGETQHNNIYNQLNYLIKEFADMMSAIKEVIGNMMALEGKSGSIAGTDGETYKKYVKYMNYVVKGCQMFSNALTHDVQALAKVGNELLAAMRQATPGSNGAEQPKQDPANNGAPQPTPTPPAAQSQQKQQQNQQQQPQPYPGNENTQALKGNTTNHAVSLTNETLYNEAQDAQKIYSEWKRGGQMSDEQLSGAITKMNNIIQQLKQYVGGGK